MGSSPGVTNLLALFAADELLDETESIDIFHTHGGEPVEGEGVIAHRFHCMSIDVPMFLDGELTYVKFFGPDGVALQEDVEFKLIGKTRVYPYPHPEQVTIPKYIKEMETRLASENKKAKDYYIHYAYCPKCAKKFGHNYMVLFAEV